VTVPDFPRSSVETLARRAGFFCSNPSCGALTTGPTVDPTSAVLIGEAAHIYGARPGTARYLAHMTDAARAEITNGLWLCRNCHRVIDADELRYPPELLFVWRTEHENRVIVRLGERSDILRMEIQQRELTAFANDPPIVRQILVDRPPGWEWRLAAELLRRRWKEPMRRLHDLRGGLYTRKPTLLPDEEFVRWMGARFNEASQLIGPLDRLMQKLTDAFGPPGLSGDPEEILHVCDLLGHALERVVEWEESVQFVNVSETYRSLTDHMKNLIADQSIKLGSIPDELDSIVALIGTDHGGTKEIPTTMTLVIQFEISEAWSAEWRRRLNEALLKAAAS